MARKIVEEALLCLQVVLHILVVVQVVACEVSEYSSGKFKSAGTFLCQRMRTYLHECIFASLFNHLGQQPVQRYCIGGGVCRWICCAVYIVAYG